MYVVDYEPIVEEKEYGKIHRDDGWELDDVWVFVDFWKKLDIEYPKTMAGLYSVIVLADSYNSKLP